MKISTWLSLCATAGITLGFASVALADLPIDDTGPSVSKDLCDDICGNCATGDDNCACNAGGNCKPTVGGPN